MPTIKNGETLNEQEQAEYDKLNQPIRKTLNPRRGSESAATGTMSDTMTKRFEQQKKRLEELKNKIKNGETLNEQEQAEYDKLNQPIRKTLNPRRGSESAATGTMSDTMTKRFEQQKKRLEELKNKIKNGETLNEQEQAEYDKLNQPIRKTLNPKSEIPWLDPERKKVIELIKNADSNHLTDFDKYNIRLLIPGNIPKNTTDEIYKILLKMIQKEFNQEK